MARAALVLAFLAALLGAPSPLLAAPPNQLTDPSATPATGTTLTRFGLSVRYTSSHGNPATGVVAEIGVVTVDLALASGSHVDGVWSGSTLLAAGTWPVTFRASAGKGPQPSVAGPILRVSVVELPSPSDPIVRPAPSEPAASPTPATVPGASQATADPTAVPKPAKSGKPSAATSGEPAPAGGGTGDGGPSGGGSGGGTGASSAAPEPAPHGSAGLAVSGGAASNDGASRASGSPRAGEDPGLLEGDPDHPGATNLLLLLGVIVSVATVALLGTGWMLASRGRDDEPEPSPAGASGRSARMRGPGGADIEERRARRRAQRLLGHDPVLAAMGLDSEDPPAPTRGSARGASPTSRPDGRR